MDSDRRSHRPSERSGLTLKRRFQEPYYRPGRTFDDLDDLYGFPFEDDLAVQLFLRRGW